MTAKEKVRAKYPKARHSRYKKIGGGGYTLIWSDYMQNHRLGEGKTTDQAWRNAARNIDGPQNQELHQ